MTSGVGNNGVDQFIGARYWYLIMVLDTGARIARW